MTQKRALQYFLLELQIAGYVLLLTIFESTASFLLICYLPGSFWSMPTWGKSQLTCSGHLRCVIWLLNSSRFNARNYQIHIFLFITLVIYYYAVCFEFPKGILRKCKAFLQQGLIRLMQEFGYCFSALREKSFQNSHCLQLH